jgi:Integrase core domain
MIKRRGPPSQGWRTFLHNHAPDIAAMDLFVVPTIGFKLLYAFVIVRLNRRDLVWINVTTNPNAEWVARQITEAFPWNEAPRYMIRDRDQIYGCHRHRHTPTACPGHPGQAYRTGSPWQNGFAERLIGSIRHECLDHVIIRGEAHLRRILRSYAMYYNNIRTHRSLDKDAPIWRPVQRTGVITSNPILGGLYTQVRSLISTAGFQAAPHDVIICQTNVDLEVCIGRTEVKADHGGRDWSHQRRRSNRPGNSQAKGPPRSQPSGKRCMPHPPTG